MLQINESIRPFGHRIDTVFTGREDERRRIAGQDQPVGALIIEERAHLLPLAKSGFEMAEVSFPHVDGLGCVRVRTEPVFGCGAAGQDGRGPALSESGGSVRRGPLNRTA